MYHLFWGGEKTLWGKGRLAVIKFLATLLTCTCVFSFSVEREVYMTKTSDVTTQSTVTKISVAANLSFPKVDDPAKPNFNLLNYQTTFSAIFPIRYETVSDCVCESFAYVIISSVRKFSSTLLMYVFIIPISSSFSYLLNSSCL